jgi:hypothetical protein
MRMIRNLNKALGLSLDVLIQDYKLDEETYKAEKYYIGLSINSRLEETIRNGPNSGMTYVIAAPKIGKSYFLTSEARNKTQNQTLGFYDELEKNFIVSVVSEKIEDVLSEYHITVGEHWLDLIRKVRDEAATNATLVKTL